ncbi:MAG: glucosamine-6-phosphate deaminase [Clostridia bacterium]|nr:glucosamine-6-phosphate deaminase [Clostridia bacterium]
MNIIKVKNYEDLSRVAADIIAEQIKTKPDSVLGLATGSSPIGTYENLVADCKAGEISFKDVKTVNLDEYSGLSGDNVNSYRYFMNYNLFDKVDIDKNNTHVPNGTGDSVEESKAYENLVASMGYADLQLLGIGNNGHIGFNEPCDDFPAATHSVDLTESTIQANSRLFDSIDEVPRKAITMGIGTIMKAKKILLIAGEGKADIVEKSVYGKVIPQVPASVLQLHPDVTVVYIP